MSSSFGKQSESSFTIDWLQVKLILHSNMNTLIVDNTSTYQTDHDYFLACCKTTKIQLWRQGRIKNLLDK